MWDGSPTGSVEPMITATHLTKRYGDVAAVSDVTFSARPGRVTGFLLSLIHI